MRVFASSIVCLALCCVVAAMSGCESSDDDSPSGSSSLPGSWSWTSLVIAAPQLADDVTVTPALLASVGKSLTLDMTASEPDVFSATAVVPDLSDLVTLAASFGLTLSDDILALAGTHQISGSWNADTITVTVPAGTFVLPYSVSGDTLTVTVPATMVEQITGNAGVSLVMTLTRN